MRILIFEKENSYAQRLSHLLADVIGSEFEVYYCETFNSFTEIMNEIKVDILLIGEELWLEYSEDRMNVLVILLCNELMKRDNENINYIYKYQSVHSISKKLLDIYTKNSPEMFSINSKKLAKTVLVYSPIGGSGKTSVSLALMQIFSRMGLQAYYLNLETFSSFAPAAKNRGGLTYLLKEAHQDRPLNISIKTASKTTRDRNYKYLPSVSSLYDLAEADNEDLISMIRALKESDVVEVVVIDCDSYYYNWIQDIFNDVDIIYLINIDKKLANAKYQSFKSLTSFYNNYLSKTKFILNRTNLEGPSEYIRIPKFKDLNDDQIIEEIAQTVDFEINLS